MSVLLEEGKKLAGRYLVERVLGRGGMGAVYLVSDSRIPGKKWAMKELWDYGDPDTRKLIQDTFQQEASILATLNHPNLPRITDFFVDGNRKYLVMDFVEGKTLEEVFAETPPPLPVDKVLGILTQLMEALGYLHGQDPPVIFRDLKPANIMVGPDGKVMLIDFGIARIFSRGKTKDTVIMGTPGFAAPEQYGTGQSDPRSDLFGLGATLYFALTGVDPSDNPFHFSTLSKINPEVYPRLEKAVLKLVQMDPGDRFRNVDKLRDYLFGPSSLTGDISPSLEGATPEPPSTKLLDQVTVEPDEIDFGKAKKGENRRGTFIIRGTVSRINARSDRAWLRVYPGLIDGTDQEVTVTAYTSSLNHGGSYGGAVFLQGENFNKTVPVSLGIEPRHLNFFTYILVFFFTLLSLLPLIGLAGFLYNSVSYFSLPRGERKSLKVFFYVTLFATLLWVIIGTFWFGIFHMGWFENWIFQWFSTVI